MTVQALPVVQPAGHRPAIVEQLNRRLSPSVLAGVAALVCLGIGCYQLSLPHVLTGVLGWNLGYDDGVYLGMATRFVNGVLPYRDFTFVHPPGIGYLLAPVALIGRGLGTRDSLVIARCLTVVVVALNVFLAGMLVRSAGRLATAVTAFALALWPLTVSVDRTVELEPYLVCLCLLGALLAFGNGALSSPRRVFFGGLLFGGALLIKLWAVLPVAAVLICCLPRWRRAVLPLALGVSVTVLVGCLPFLIAAPHQFFHEVVVTQAHRQALVGATVGFDQRLEIVSGLGAVSAFDVPLWLIDGLFGLFGILVGLVFGLGWRERTRLEWFALVASIIVFVGMMLSPDLYDHYAYFPLVFLTLLLGIAVGRSRALVRRLVASRRRSRRLPLRPSPAGWLRAAVLAGVLLVAGGVSAFFVQQTSTFSAAYLSEASDPGAQIAAVIPAGACVISDYPVDLLDAGRFTPAGPGCPALVDPYGVYLSEDNGNPPHPSAPWSNTIVEHWLQAFRQAQYVEFRIPYTDFFPWPPVMLTWFNDSYRLVAHFRDVYPQAYIDQHKDEYIYERTG